jgi:hypothetical protein
MTVNVRTRGLHDRASDRRADQRVQGQSADALTGSLKAEIASSNVAWVGLRERVRAGQRAVAQLGSALDWGSRGREFKSRQPDQRIERKSGHQRSLSEVRHQD